MQPVRIKLVTKKCGTGEAPFLYAGKYLFIHDMACREYDWLAVYDELPDRDAGTFRNGREPLACPRSRTILMTCEPVSIKDYGRFYPRQFGTVLTNQPLSVFPGCRTVLGQGYYKWFYGKGYDETAAQPPVPKTRTISVVCSSKQQRHTAHHDRFSLIRRLSETIPELEWFGHGVRRIDRKFDALDPFKYHIAVENHLAPHHWTEKIADALLARCLPFYAGDPLLGTVLPKESFIPIPLDDPDEAAAIIRGAITADAFTQRREAIEAARRLLLERYNLWAQVAAVIETAPQTGDAPGGELLSRHELRKNPRVALSDAWRRAVRFFRHEKDGQP
ncbi:MAG: glycosyltransferase [Kiritimatiellae bacterium]|nr:glycosyltransferase [Kiritimatiellia bacterium]